MPGFFYNFSRRIIPNSYDEIFLLSEELDFKSGLTNVTLYYLMHSIKFDLENLRARKSRKAIR